MPLPWTSDAATAFGFSGEAPIGDPWLPQPADWGDYSVERQEHDPSSMLPLYRHLLSARRARLDPEAGLTFLDVEHPDLLVLRRGDVTVVLNVGAVEIDLGRAMAPTLPIG